MVVKSHYGVMDEFWKSKYHVNEREKNQDRMSNKLLEKHADAWDTPRLRSWARMICSGCDNDYDNPPLIPAFGSTIPKKQRRENLSEALTGAFALVVSGIG